jgi:hypothetical protein
VFVDVGANEDVYCAVTGKIVGEEGSVVAIEPQAGLRGIIEINCRLNDSCSGNLDDGAGPAGRSLPRGNAEEDERDGRPHCFWPVVDQEAAFAASTQMSVLRPK